MNGDPAWTPPAEPARRAGGIPELEAEAAQVRSVLGLGTAVFLLPGYILAVFGLLTWAQPRALGTYSFLLGGPLVMGLLSARLAARGFWRAFWQTTASLLVLAIGLYWLELEKGLCLVIMLLPFVAFFSLTLLALNWNRLRIVHAALRDARTRVVLLLLMPLGALLEQSQLEGASPGEVTTSVLIAAPPEAIWPGIVRVDTFSEAELPRTWLTKLGVPRPVHAEVELVRGEPLRVGYFEGGLRFRERFTTLRPAQELGLSVEVDQSSLAADDPLGHAFSLGYVHLDDVRYHLTPAAGGTRLSLSCRYTVRTTVTGYAHAVGRVLIGRFEADLLRALRQRFEGPVHSAAPLLVAELQ